MQELIKRSLSEQAAILSRGECSAVELTEAHFAQIDARDGVVGAYLSTDREGALAAARASDERRARGESLGALDGIPYALKDNICAEGLPMTCASHMMCDYIAPYDATVTARLKRAGAVLLGKNNMDEFAMGSTTEYSALGVTRNPHDPERVPGGSSGGSAAAVAAYEATFSLGTDTGGSVRQPASFCGVYGLKPTWGAVSRYGVAAMASSLDCIGVMTRTAADCAAVYSTVAGKDPMDATSQAVPPTALSIPLRGKKIAVVAAFSEDQMDGAVWKAMKRAEAILCDAGATVETVNLPLPRQALATYSVLSCAEASSNLGRYDGVHFGKRSEEFDDLVSLYDNSRARGFGEEVRRRILFGTDMLSDGNREFYYVRAQRVRELIRNEMTSLSRHYDLLLTPTTPTPAFKRGNQLPLEQRYCADLCTVYANLSGFPALSIPFGKNEAGLPLSVQLTARPFEEALLLSAAQYFEEVGV